ncbi:MAG: DNA polymerase III subunit delta', partial [Candidatus Limosilactobacillus intestinavium]
NNKNAVLPTIQSRTQVIEMRPLPKEITKQMMDDQSIPEYLRSVALGLTDSAEQAAKWVADDWLAKAVDAVVQWYKELTNGDPVAFVGVQTVMKGLANDRERQQVILDLMALIWRDALVIKTKAATDSNLYFVQWKQIINQGLLRYQTSQIIQVSQVTLEAHQLLEQNINFQNVAEQQTLRILQILHG